MHVIAVDASSVHVCIDKWHPTASMLCPLSLPCKKNRRNEIVVTLKTKLKMHILREFPGYWWLVERKIYRVMALGCLKKKEEDEQF